MYICTIERHTYIQKTQTKKEIQVEREREERERERERRDQKVVNRIKNYDVAICYRKVCVVRGREANKECLGLFCLPPYFRWDGLV